MSLVRTILPISVLIQVFNLFEKGDLSCTKKVLHNRQRKELPEQNEFNKHCIVQTWKCYNILSEYLISALFSRYHLATLLLN